MKKIRLIPAAAVFAAVATLAACDSASSSSAAATAPTSAQPSASAVSGAGHYDMQAMPAGTVTFQSAAGGGIEARVSMFGLTPGSSHEVSAGSVQFPALTAGAGGQASATLIPAGHVTTLPAGSRMVIDLGDASGDQLASEPVAESPVLPADPQPGSSFSLQAVSVTEDGTSFGHAAGSAELSYDAAARTLTITVTASGVTPGAHAAHIHLGSCEDQGPVKYMLADFTANADGDITDETRVVTGVPGVPGPGAWYLNLHLGSGSQILSAAGTPTLYFRPVLCTNVSTFALADG